VRSIFSRYRHGERRVHSVGVRLHEASAAVARSCEARDADRKPEPADLCLTRMSELHPKLPVITVDREDFRVYRRNKREVIPLTIVSIESAISI